MPQHVRTEVLAAVTMAERDPRLSREDRAIFAACCKAALESGSLEIMVAARWLEQETGILRHVERSRRRLEQHGYLRRIMPNAVTSVRLAEHVDRRRKAHTSVPNLYAIGTPEWPTCEHCDGPIPDVQRSSRRFCSDRCRKAARRLDPIVEAVLDSFGQMSA